MHSTMSRSVLELLVLGKIPGLNIELGYFSSLFFAAEILLLLALILLVARRRSIARILTQYSMQAIDKITL